MSATAAPIVVGIDGSESGLSATRWAAAEAARHGVPLLLLEAARWPDGHHVADAPVADQSEREFLDGARDCLDKASEVARAVDESVRVSGEIRPQSPVAMLVEASAAARMVVVGSRGLSGVMTVVGSIALSVIAQASSPVVVVRGPLGTRGGSVVVGVDDSAAADAVISFAFDAAADDGVPLVAVRVWHEDLVPYAREALLIDWALVGKGIREEVERRLAPYRAKYPQVSVELVVSRSQAAGELIARSGTARLVVVGSRGRGGVAGALLGSTSQTVLRHAECPVAVVRGSHARDGTFPGELTGASPSG